MIGSDEFRGKVRTDTYSGELTMHRHVQTAGSAEAGVQTTYGHQNSIAILAASYSFGSHYVDVTKRVQDLLRAGETFQANPHCLLADPQPGWNKALVIFCKVRGKRAIFSVGESEDISRELLLKNARVLDKRTRSEKLNPVPN